jgi:hypothetical protein
MPAWIRSRSAAALQHYADKRGLTLDELADGASEHAAEAAAEVKAATGGAAPWEGDLMEDALARVRGGHPAGLKSQLERALDDALFAHESRMAQLRRGR